MALEPCRECGNQISTQALTCPHCGAPAPGARRRPTITVDTLVGLTRRHWKKFAVAAGIMFLISLIPSSDHTARAVVHCEGMIRQRLAAPSTARFHYAGRERASRQEYNYVVEGFVDAQNRMGVMLRSPFVCDLTYVSETRWLINRVEIAET